MPRFEETAAKELRLTTVGQPVTVVEVVSWTVGASDAESVAVFEKVRQPTPAVVGLETCTRADPALMNWKSPKLHESLWLPTAPVIEQVPGLYMRG